MDEHVLSNGFEELLASRGVTRRGFLQLCGSIVAAAGAYQLTVPQVAHAIEESVIGAATGNLFPVIWIEGASCTGCTEAFAQIDQPDPATVVLEMISCNYNETLSFAAGHSVEEAKAQTIKDCAGNYILVYEGALLEGWDGWALRVAEDTGLNAFAEAAESAFGVVALGSCAVNGGWMGSYPAPSGAIGCQAYMAKRGITTPVVNIPGCPANPEWLVSVLVDVVLMGTLPELNAENKPALIFNQTIHDNCQRRGHFENGEFVYKFGSEEEKKGYCLYAMGCRGPQTKANCGVVRYNHRRSWCVESGAPCIGCCEADPMNPGHNWVEVNAPFYKRHRDLRIGNWVLQPSTIALGLTGLVAAALVVNGFGISTARKIGKLRYEDKREWDAKNPDHAIGDYDADRTLIGKDGAVLTVTAEEFARMTDADYQVALAQLGRKVPRVAKAIQFVNEDGTVTSITPEEFSNMGEADFRQLLAALGRKPFDHGAEADTGPDDVDDTLSTTEDAHDETKGGQE